MSKSGDDWAFLDTMSDIDRGFLQLNAAEFAFFIYSVDAIFHPAPIRGSLRVAPFR